MQYLSSHPRSAASREALVEAFWPDLDTESVRHRLHLAATGARSALRLLFPTIDAIRCVGGSYGWHPAISVESDYDELLNCHRDGSEAAMKRGIALYVGEFCAGEVAEWMYALRARAVYSYTAMLERLAEASLSRAEYLGALDYALQLIEVDRGHEGATRMAMRAFAALDRRGAALETYEALKRWLQRDLHVLPSPSTTALREAIAQGCTVGTAVR